MTIARSAFFLGLVLLPMPGSLLRAQGLRMSWDASIGLDGDAGRFSLGAIRHFRIVPDRWSIGLGLRLPRLRAGSSHYVLGYTVTDRSSGAALVSRSQRFFTVPFLAISLGR